MSRLISGYLVFPKICSSDLLYTYTVPYSPGYIRYDNILKQAGAEVVPSSSLVVVEVEVEIVVEVDVEVGRVRVGLSQS